jgi:hypothetical protein
MTIKQLESKTFTIFPLKHSCGGTIIQTQIKQYTCFCGIQVIEPLNNWHMLQNQFKIIQSDSCNILFSVSNVLNKIEF